MTLLITSILGGAVTAYAQEVGENQVAAENLLSILMNSESEVKSLFETIVGDGGEVPEVATEALIKAQKLHADALGHYDEGRYEECVEKSTEAINKYGEALTEATPEEPEVMITHEETVETEKMTGLTTAIEKTRKRIIKLEKNA